MVARKRIPRLRLKLPVTFWEREGGARMSGHILNVSTAGAYVATYESLRPGTALVLEVELPGKIIRVSGQVIHDKEHVLARGETLFTAGMGVRFDLPDTAEVAEMLKYGRPQMDGGGRRKRPR